MKEKLKKLLDKLSLQELRELLQCLDEDIDDVINIIEDEIEKREGKLNGA